MRNGIYCLESLWTISEIDENRQSVYPLIRLVAKLYGVKSVHFDIGTREELVHRLQRGRKRGLKVLYIATHGSKGKIEIENPFNALTLDELKFMIGRRFAGWSIHLGTCRTLDVPDEELAQFKKDTGVKVLTGYRKDSYFDSDYYAMEIALLTTLVNGRKKLPKRYNALVRQTGLVIR
jgi:hypothetical protein